MKWYNQIALAVKLLLLSLIVGLLYKERDFLLSVYEITQFEKSYYTISMKNGKVDYQRSTKIPHNWFIYREISKNVRGAILVSEDGKFLKHQGYDPLSLRDKIYDVFIKKKKLKGGSTITQQLVKNLYLSKDKTLSRKGREFVLSILLEKYASKEKIFETYLNVIEYGENLYGIGSATQYYFKKLPKKILPREAAFLAMLLPSPVRYSRSFKNKILSRYARRQVDSILLRMRQNNYIGSEEYELGLNRSMVFEKKIDTIEFGSGEADTINNEWFSI